MIRRMQSSWLAFVSGIAVLAISMGLLIAKAALAQIEQTRSASDFDIRGPVSHALPQAPQSNQPQTFGAPAATAPTSDYITIRWSALTGGVSRIYSTTGTLTEPSSAAAVDIAVNYLGAHLTLFNLSPEDISELVLTRNFVSENNGVTHLTFQQLVGGIAVFGGAIDVNITRDGQVLNISGEPMPGIHASVNASTPLLTSDDAVARAATAAGVANVRTSQSDGLVYFPLAIGNARLAWDVTLDDADTPNVYRSLVDATDGTVLWRTNLTKYAIATHGQVFEGDSPIPNNPVGTSTGSVPRTDQFFHGGGQVFPRGLGTPIFPSGDVHFDWWAGAARTVTTSNNVQSQEDRNGDNTDGTQATSSGDDFTQPLDLTQDPSTYTAAAIVNLFYWTNHLHDIWYRYGFTEAAGNQQTNNFGLGGIGNDALIADAQDNRDGNAVCTTNADCPDGDVCQAGLCRSLCNANNTTRPDGTANRMQMFQCTSATPERDGDFDNGVIVHEHHHGMAQRLRPGLHSGSQGGGMGEGGGDFEALAVLAKSGDDPNANYALGQYLFNNPNGIRRGFYSIRPGVYPFTYGDISISSEVHDVGEIWANTLWIARALLVSRYGFLTGTDTILQLQIDGYKLAPANPDFLDMRDSILQADQVDNGGINQCLLWQAFARMGMGASASTTGNNDSAPVEAFDTPLECTPQISINPSLLDFGFVPVNPVGGESEVKSVDFNICNVGTSDLFVTNVTLQSPNAAFSIVPPPPGGFPLPISHDFCHTIEVHCNPSIAGLTTATVQIESTDPLNAIVLDPQLKCTGAVPTAQVSPNPLSFGNVPTDPVGGEVGFKDASLKVRNTGNSNLQVTSIAATGGNAGDFTVLTPVPGFPTIIAVGAEFDFQIRCNPSAAGLRTTTLRVTSNSGGTAGTTTDVSANCTGTVPDIRVSGSTDFGDVCTGTTAEKQISICNNGNSNLEVSSVGFNPACADFTIVNNPFPATVSPDFCTPLTIRFTPTSSGPKSCTLVINSNDPDTPIVSKTVTANTPAASIDVPPNQSFLPEVIQSEGVCTTLKPFPISNTGACNLNITNVTLGGANVSDFGLSGLPSFPIILQPGHIAGEGDLNTVFAPTAVDRDRLGTLTVTYESDPITHATTQVSRDLCGEGVLTGARVLVRAGGVPLAMVERIQLQRINANRNKTQLDTNDVARNLALQTVTPGGACAPFQFHREYGTVSNPIQLLPGSYQVTATAIVNGKRQSKTVGFDVTTCDFNPTVVVDF
jgi:fungalysin metallopeptidase (M36)/fungalysin/thermolysin propeptide/ASPM-SPD-2-Hydin domain-containing protein